MEYLGVQIRCKVNTPKDKNHDIMLSEVQLAKKEEKEGNNWFMNMLSGLLQNIPGYDLLTMVIGRDPVSGQEVKGDGAAYLAALVGLIPGGHLLMKNLEEAKVITKAVNCTLGHSRRTPKLSRQNRNLPPIGTDRLALWYFR